MENGLEGNKEEVRENTGACYKSHGQKWSEVDVPGYLNHTSKIELAEYGGVAWWLRAE